MNYADIAAINVNSHTEKKGNLTYLSWAWAVDQLQRLAPDATWEYKDPTVFPDGTMMIYCTVQAFGRFRTAQLPVMDFRNKAIANPDAMAVNTAMQRCLAKAIALHGLGLYIYAGEDLPAGAEPSDPKAPAEAKPKPPVSVPSAAWDDLTIDQQTQLQDIADCVRIELAQKGPQSAIALLKAETEDLEIEHKNALWSRFDSKERAAMSPEKRPAKKAA